MWSCSIRKEDQKRIWNPQEGFFLNVFPCVLFISIDWVPADQDCRLQYKKYLNIEYLSIKDINFMRRVTFLAFASDYFSSFQTEPGCVLLHEYDCNDDTLSPGPLLCSGMSDCFWLWGNDWTETTLPKQQYLNLIHMHISWGARALKAAFEFWFLEGARLNEEVEKF